MKKLINIKHSKKQYSVHLHLSGEQFLCHVVFAEYKENSLTVLSQHSYAEQQHLLDALDKKFPVIITLTGDGVISKKAVNKANYLQEVLFTSNPEDFFIYSRPIEQIRLVSVTRKTQINQLLKAFNSHGIGIIDVLLGPWSLYDFSTLFEQNSLIQTPNFTFDSETFQINASEQINTDLQDYIIADQSIKAASTIAFASLVHHFTQGQQFINFESLVAQLSERFTYKKRVKTVGIAAILFLFLSLSASYGLSAIYAQKNANIQAQLSLNNSLQQQITELQTDIANKESIVRLAGLGSDTYLSEYIWEIAAAAPAQISLTQAQIFPLEKKIKEEEAIEFTQNQIEVSGNSDGALIVSDWVAKLKEIKWVQTVEITAFTLVGNQYEFTLKIEI